MSTLSAADASAELNFDMEKVATALCGKARSSRTRTELRFGSRGSLSVEIAGAKCGKWFDHEAGIGGDALDLVKHLRGCSMADALAWCRGWLGRPDAALTPQPTPAARSALDDKRSASAFAKKLWTESIPAADTPAEAYLASRALRLPEADVLRYHPACPDGKTDRRPAMVALMTHPQTCEPTGIHRTFLTLEGRKAEIPIVKKMLGRAGIVRLSPDESVTYGLGIAEGIETGLSLIQVAGWAPVWACGSAGAISGFPVLAGIEGLTIFADADSAGIKAAHACGERWIVAGREARIIRPRSRGDWNDVARAAAA